MNRLSCCCSVLADIDKRVILSEVVHSLALHLRGGGMINWAIRVRDWLIRYVHSAQLASNKHSIRMIVPDATNYLIREGSIARMNQTPKTLTDGSQLWRRWDSMRKLPKALVSTETHQLQKPILVSLFFGSKQGLAAGIRWLQQRHIDDQTLELFSLKFTVDTDMKAYEEIWYQFGDILYPTVVKSLCPILYHEGPYELDQQCSVKKGDVVIDVGANMGMFSVVTSCKASRIIAFEPDDTANAMLQKNLSLNSIANVTVLNTACSASAGLGTLTNEGGLGTARLNQLTKDSKLNLIHPRPVEVTTIDETVNILELGIVDFIKMDIEGSEPLALMGAKETIAKYLPRLSICTYHQEDHPNTIRQMLDQASHNRYKYIQTRFKLHAFPSQDYR